MSDSETRHEKVNQVITDDELNKLLDDAIEELGTDDVDEDMFATLIAVTRQGFDGELEKGSIVVFADMPEPGEPRIAAFKGLGMEMADKIFFKERPYNMPMALVSTVEMWYIAANDKSDDKMVSEHDNKQEGVMIHVMALDGRSAMAMYNIDRNKAGKKIGYTMKSYTPYRFGANASSESYLGQAFFQGAYADFLKGKK